MLHQALRSLCLKIRDHASFAPTLVLVTAAVDIRDGVVWEYQIALGGGTEASRSSSTATALAPVSERNPGL